MSHREVDIVAQMANPVTASRFDHHRLERLDALRFIALAAITACSRRKVFIATEYAYPIIWAAYGVVQLCLRRCLITDLKLTLRRV